MPTAPPAPPPAPALHRSWWLALAAPLLALGLRWTYIAEWGVNYPYGDQWFTDPHVIKSLAGEETLSVPGFWLAYNNEHRIFFHRALVYAVIALTGRWDSTAMMFAQAVFGVVPLALLLLAFRRLPWFDWSSVVVLAAAFCLPLGTENLLWAFQSQFYTVILFATLLAWTASMTDLRRWRTFGLLMTIATFGYFNIAAGIFCYTMVALAYVVESSRTGRWRWSLARIAIAVLATAWCIQAIPGLWTPDPHKARSISRFVATLGHFTAWPRNLPLLGLALFAVALVRRRAALLERPEGRFLLLLAFWLFSTFAMLSYGRVAVANRYIDLQLLWPICAMGLLDLRLFEPKPMRVVGWVFKLLLLLAFVDYAHTTARNSANALLAEQRALLTTAQQAYARYKDDPVGARSVFVNGSMPIKDADLAWDLFCTMIRTRTVPPGLAR